MGFREGSGLGKDGSGRAEPIAIGIGNGRLGLGVMEEKRRELEEAFQNQKRTETSLRESFLDSKKRTFETSKVLRDLEKAQKACEELDVASGILQSDLWTERGTQEGQGPTQDVAEALSAHFFLFRLFSTSWIAKGTISDDVLLVLIWVCLAAVVPRRRRCYLRQG